MGSHRLTPMATHHIAQLNIARLAAPIESPALSEFVANLERINALADDAPGFVWRFISSLGESAVEARLFGDDHIVNMSVWTDIDALHNYVYRSAHAEIMARRKEWFQHMREAYHVLWWVPEGQHPTLVQASRKLSTLREHGPSADAFTFKQPFSADSG